jgi:hypothetical protein
MTFGLGGAYEGEISVEGWKFVFRDARLAQW